MLSGMMKQQNNTFLKEARTAERLTALWAFTESGIGGFLHAFHLPFSGILVGGLSVIWISLIARFSNSPAKSIIQSGIVVLVLKGILSPQSPPGAYFALTIQILVGALLFLGRGRLAYRAFVLAFVTILFSAFQKIIILTVLFGQPLWDSINTFGNQVTTQLAPIFPGISASEFFIGLFVFVYLVAGIVIGRWNFELMRHTYVHRVIEIVPETQERKNSNKKRSKTALFIAVTALIIVAAQGFLLDQWSRAFSSIFRAAIVLCIWFLILLPILRLAARRKSQQWKALYQEQIDRVRDFVPVSAALLKAARKSQKNEGKKGFKSLFILWLEYSLSYEKEHYTIDGPDTNG